MSTHLDDTAVCSLNPFIIERITGAVPLMSGNLNHRNEAESGRLLELNVKEIGEIKHDYEAKAIEQKRDDCPKSTTSIGEGTPE